MLANLGVINYWAFVVATVGVILVPGPNSLFVLTTSAKDGVALGYQAAVGILVGDAILMTLSALGISSVLRAIPVLFLFIKAAGAIYLFYLGVMILKKVLAKSEQPLEQVSLQPNMVIKKQRKHSPFFKALLLSLSNPKAILFTVAFFIQFVDPGSAHPGLAFLVLGITLETISVSYLTFLIFSGSSLAAWFNKRRRLTKVANASVGLLFVGFGIRLAIASID